MKISIITPTYNSEKNILANVQSILNQTYKNFEHIIIDNLSKDSTLEIIKSNYLSKNLLSNLQIISEKDYGISDAFNKGIKSASGDIITILNSDDYYTSIDVFTKVVEMFKISNIGFVHGNILFNDDIYGSNIRKPLLCDIREAMPFNHPTMFLKKDIYKIVGYFNLKYKFAMDYDLAVRIVRSTKDFEINQKYINGEPLVVMNFGGASWTNEINSIHETKRILQENNLWDSFAVKHYYLRIFRTRLKGLLNLIGFNFLVKSWRKKKWKQE